MSFSRYWAMCRKYCVENIAAVLCELGREIMLFHFHSDINLVPLRAALVRPLLKTEDKVAPLLTRADSVPVRSIVLAAAMPPRETIDPLFVLGSLGMG